MGLVKAANPMALEYTFLSHQWETPGHPFPMLHVVCQKQLTTCWHVSPVELDLFLIDSADWIHAAASLVEADLNGVMYAVAQLADTNADFAGMISPCRCLHHNS